MCEKLIAIIAVVVAVVLAVLGVSMPPDKLAMISLFPQFIDIMIPVLAVGALIKYLFFCHANGKSRCKDTSSN